MDRLEFPYGRDIPLTDGEPIEVFLGTGVMVTAPTLETGVRAIRVLTESGSFADGEAITIGRLDTSTQVYTLKTSLTPTIGEVLIGANTTAALVNLLRAITGTGTPGTDYATGTEPCLDWDVASDSTTLTITAINYGEDYDAAADAAAETGGSTSWAVATDGEDTPDFRQSLDFTTAATAVAAPAFRDGVAIFCPTAAQLTMKRGVFELDDNGGSDFLRQNIEVITTDHPAAGRPKGALYAGVLDATTDLSSGGTTVEIPNLSHGSAGDWVGGSFSVPDEDNVINSLWMVIFSPYSGDRAVAEIKSYDYTDVGFGTNQGKITFVVGGGMRIATVLRNASVLWYLIYESNVGLAAELGVQAKLDVNIEADLALADNALDSGTLQAGGTSTQAILPSAREFANDILNGTIINLLTGTGAGQSRVIIDYALSGDIATVDHAWITNPDATTTYQIVQGSVNIEAVDNVAENLATKAEMDTAHALLATPANVASELATYDGPTRTEATSDKDAIISRGDSAWTTGGGGSLLDILNLQPVLPTSIDLANTATVRLGLILTNALDDLPSTAEITPGTISIDRKAIGGTSWSSVVSDGAMSEQAGMVFFDEVFDAGSGYAEGDSIRITFKAVKITVSANDFEICDSNGIIFQTEIRQTMRGTDSANTIPPPSVAQIQIEMEEDGASLLDTIRDELANATDGLTALKTAIDAIPTTPMRGTDSVVLAGPTKAEMDSAHALLATGAKQDTGDTETTAIKGKTDQMVFTKTNELDANIKSINEAEVVGDGDTTGWDGA